MRDINFREEKFNIKANCWLMCIELEIKKDWDLFLKETKNNIMMTRPIWQLIFKSSSYADFKKRIRKMPYFWNKKL